jgi:hypothetical protein
VGRSGGIDCVWYEYKKKVSVTKSELVIALLIPIVVFGYIAWGTALQNTFGPEINLL